MNGRVRASIGAAGWLAALAISGAPSEAAEVERVTDGGFDATTCSDASTCSNPNWTTIYLQARFCSDGSGVNCVGSNGVSFARLGYSSYSNISSVFNAGGVGQSVVVPEAPARLTYRLRFNDAPFANVDFAVALEGVQLESFSSATAPTPGFVARTVDLTPYVSAAPQQLQFQMQCTAANGQLCDAFDVDDISIVTGAPDSPEPPPGGGATGPDTVLSKTPARKTKRKQARFEFSSPSVGATFECALDGKGFSACNSPRILRVRKGKHNFQVRAIAGGMTDATPASYDWTVKKKKKRKNGAGASGKRDQPRLRAFQTSSHGHLRAHSRRTA